MTRESLVDQISERLAAEGIYVDVGLTDTGVLLSGLVTSPSERAQAETLASQVAGNLPVENNLDVAQPGEIPPSVETEEYLEQPFDQEPLNVIGSGEEEDGETVYFPPTDPVMEEAEVLGGFDATSMDSLDVASSSWGRVPGDEALAEAVRRELREDAATTDLAIDVVVEEGVVYLRGRVLSLEDVENAEEVAGRLPGVREVVEELDLG